MPSTPKPKDTYASAPLKALIPGTDAFKSRKKFNDEYNSPRKSADAAPAPMGSQGVIDKRMKEAGAYKNGGMVKMTPKATPYKCGGKVK